MERTKKALDMFFTVRTLCPEIYKNKDPRIISKEEHYCNKYSVKKKTQNMFYKKIYFAENILKIA